MAAVTQVQTADDKSSDSMRKVYLILDDLFARVKHWLGEQVNIRDQNPVRVDLLVDTIGYLCLKSRFKDALFQADFASFINNLVNLVVKDNKSQLSLPQHEGINPNAKRTGLF